jgi:hypothetical protein
MLIELARESGPSAWAPIEVIAAAGVVGTFVTAISSLVVQGVLNAIGHRRDARRKRDEELIAVYSEVGRIYSASLRTFYELFEFGDDGQITHARTPEETKEATNSALAALEPRHNTNMMKLHGAGSSVEAAMRELTSNMSIPSLPKDTNPKTWWDARLKLLEDGLSNFYVASGIDARKQGRP